MNVKTNAEKEWLRKLTTGKPVEKKEQTAPVKVTAEKENKRPERKDVHGFRDVAGMDEPEATGDGRVHQCPEQPGMCQGIRHHPAKSVVLRPCRMRQDLLCREDCRGSGHQLHEDCA